MSLSQAIHTGKVERKVPEGLALPSARKAIQSVWQAGEARKIVSRNPICPGRRASDIEGEQKTGFAPLSNIRNRG